MKKSAFISDLIFTFFITAVLSVCLLRYLKFPLPLAAIFSLLIAFVAVLPVWLFLDRKRRQSLLLKKEETEQEKLLLQLALSSDKKNAEYLSSLLNNDGFFSALFPAPEGTDESAPSQKTVTVTAFSSLQAVETPEAILFPLFSMRPTDGDKIAEIIRVQTDKKKRLFCGELSPEAQRLCRDFSIAVIDGKALYRLLKDHALLPEHYAYEPTPPPKKREQKKRLWFAKTNCRPFLISGTLLLISSLLTPFPFYYLIGGSFLLLASVLVRVFGYR